MLKVGVLPQEILDYILDFLHDDSRSLKACALASRALLQTARYHRLNGQSVGPYQLRMLSDLLVASPDLARTVKRLKIWFSYQEEQDNGILESTPMIIIPPVLPCLRPFTALVDLRITVTALRYLSPYVPQLTALRVEGTHRVSPIEFISGIASFPLLHELEVDNVRLFDYEIALNECPTAPRLQKLLVCGGDCASLLSAWLAASNATPPCHMLEHTIRNANTTVEFAKLADALAPLVQVLEVRFLPDGSMDAALSETELGLGSFGVLQRCTLRFGFPEMCVPQNFALSWIPNILAQLSSPHLPTLTISLAVDNVEDLRSLNSECAIRVISPAYFDDMRILDWIGIERALLDDRLSQLRHVVLEGRGKSEMLVQHIREACPELHSRDMLTFVPVGMEVPWLG